MKHTVVMSQGWPEVFSESLLLPDPGNVFLQILFTKENQHTLGDFGFRATKIKKNRFMQQTFQGTAESHKIYQS